MKLAEQSCAACRADSPAVVGGQRDELMAELDDWRIVDEDNVPQLERAYGFKNFIDALAFTNAIGELAEKEDHHPCLTTEWGKVTVRWWTHTINGLHLNDFILAARCDEHYAASLERG